jgi:hypothetical protein
MKNDYKYPPIEVIEWDQFPDYIRMDPTKNDEWYIYQFGYLRTYLMKVIEGWSIKDFFESIPVEKIAIYPITVFTDIIKADLRRSTEKSIYVSDKKIATEKEEANLQFLPPERLFEKYEKKEVDKVVVCSMLQENVIMDDLLEMGFKLEDVVTLSSILLNG